MINHQIKPGVSTTFTREARLSNALYPDGASGGVLDYLVSTATVVEVSTEASGKMLDSLLPEGFITVGKEIQLTHERGAMLGEPLIYDLVVRKVDDDNIDIDVIISDKVGVVCTGKFKRVIVNKEELINRAFKRAAEKA